MSAAFVADQFRTRSATIASNIQSKAVEEVLDVCLLLGLKELNLALIGEAGVSRKDYAGALGADPSLRVTTTTLDQHPLPWAASYPCFSISNRGTTRAQ
jgi:hypothetical protein